MKKDFDVFNNIDIDLTEFEVEKISDLEKKKIKKIVIKKIREKNNKRKIVSGLVASLTMISVLILGSEGVYAKILSQVESFFNKTSEQLEPYKILDDDITIVKTTEANGLKVSFTDLILDDMYLLGKIEVDWSDVNLDKYGIPKEDVDKVKFLSWGEGELYLDNKVISKKRSIYNESKEEKKISQFIRIEYNYKNLDLTKKQKITFSINDLRLESDKSVQRIEGEWNFDIDIDGRELSKRLKVVEINNKQSFENEFYKCDILVKEYRESPISKKIILRENGEGISPWYNLKTEFYDEEDNKIEHSWVASNDERTILEIKDNKKYKKIKIINSIIDTKDGLNKEIEVLEPIIIDLEN